MASNGNSAFRQNTSTPVSAQNTQAQTPGAILPRTLAVKSLAENLFQASGYNCTILNQAAIIPNQSVSFNLTNTGLVEKVSLAIKGSINLKNTAGTTQDVSLAYDFPFNIIQNLNVLFNGQLTLVNASGYELLAMSGKRNKNVFLRDFSGYTGRTAKAARVSRDTANITVGAGLTLTAGDNICGYNKVTVAANTTGTLSFEIVLEIPFVFRHDTPLGLLALQNNSIVAQVNITAPSILGTTAQSPCYVATAVPSTLTVDSSAISATPVQYYWETPADKTLYAYFVANSYMLLSTPNLTAKTTGTQALQYQMQNNFILTALLLTARDSNGGLVDPVTSFDYPTLNYNNNTNVDRMPLQVREYLQERFYQNKPFGLGQVLWDACIHEYESNNLSDSSFLNMYTANNPQFYMDILNGVSVPLTYSALREIIVPAQVKSV